MKTSESIANLAAAFAKFQAECPAPKKSATNPHFKSKYSPLEEILNTIKPHMSANGLSQLQSTMTEGEQIGVKTIILHSSGEYFEFDVLWLPMGKANAQGAGSSVTYARRYALCAALGIAADEDDDGNAASDPQPQKQTYQKKYDKPKITTVSITKEQIGELKITAGVLGQMRGKSMEEVIEAAGVTNIEALTQEQANAVIAKINKWTQQAQEEATKAGA